MTADNLPRRLLRFVRRNRRRNADWWADEWCREATERDALARRMDAVRGYAETAVGLGRALGDPSMERVGADVLRLLDGDGEAGE